MAKNCACGHLHATTVSPSGGMWVVGRCDTSGCPCASWKPTQAPKVRYRFWGGPWDGGHQDIEGIYPVGHVLALAPSDGGGQYRLVAGTFRWSR